jgi:hypothetical protein
MDALGDRFSQFITPGMIENAYQLALTDLRKNYDEPGTVKRYHPQSKNLGFKPYMTSSYRRDQGMGFPYFGCIHQGRSRPRMELHSLVGLASTGHQGARQKAIELMKHRVRVPHDFTDFLIEDAAQLPREVQFYARGVGPIAMEWYRNYWLLKGME